VSRRVVLRIATRGSQLALAQSSLVARRIEKRLGVETELVEVRTTGDRIQEVSLAKIGGKGLFIKEIEEALLEGRADLAVHSAKDLPAAIAPGLVLAAIPERADPRDALVGRGEGARLEELPRGARVGTGSVRRGSQLRAVRPDLEIVPLRGNVDTRLRKLEEQGLHAVILACAGLDRLGLGDRIQQRVSPELLLPAVGQGTLAIEARDGDPVAEELDALDHRDTRAELLAERAFLSRLEGDCNVPLAALARRVSGDGIVLEGLVASPDGRQRVRASAEAKIADAALAGSRAAEEVLRGGAESILEGIRAEATT
jgi:hydroxymethylbilane synthase